MKRVVSLALCLVMIVSVFGITAVAASNGNPKNLFSVSTSGYKNDKITYTVSLKPGVSISGAIIKVVFDPDVLQVVSGGAAMKKDPDGDDIENIGGEYVNDMQYQSADSYAFGYVYSSSDSKKDFTVGSSAKEFVKVTFKVKDVKRPKTEVKFYCEEFLNYTKTENNIEHDADILFYSDLRATLGSADITSVNAVSDGINITWNSVPGAVSYRVYRKAGNATSWGSPYVSGITKTSYKDKSVKNNTQYKYLVRAENESGIDNVAGAQGSIIYFSAPKTLTAKLSGNDVVLTWSKVSGASAYKVYRRIVNSDGSYGAWSRIMTGKNVTTFTDAAKNIKSGKKYQYAVRAYSGSSDGVTVYATLNYLTMPTAKVSAAYTGVKISWSSVTGASKYRIYRKVKGENSWTKLTDAASSKTSYTDTKAPGNKTIYYMVKAVAADGSTSSGKTVSLTYIKAPAAKVANTSSGVKVSWNKVSGAKQYIIYRKNSNGGWTKLATTTSASYTDKTVKNNKTYTYTVRAYNGSVYSGYDTNGVKIKFLSAPTLSSAVSGKNGITFKWQKVSGASGYYVYRKTGSGSYTKIATVKSGSTVSYLDKSAQKGKTYTYTVKAYNGSYTSSYKTGISCKDIY